MPLIWSVHVASLVARASGSEIRLSLAAGRRAAMPPPCLAGRHRSGRPTASFGQSAGDVDGDGALPRAALEVADRDDPAHRDAFPQPVPNVDLWLCGQRLTSAKREPRTGSGVRTRRRRRKCRAPGSPRSGSPRPAPPRDGARRGDPCSIPPRAVSKCSAWERSSGTGLRHGRVGRGRAGRARPGHHSLGGADQRSPFRCW